MQLGALLPFGDIGGDPAVVRDYAQAAEAIGYTCHPRESGGPGQPLSLAVLDSRVGGNDDHTRDFCDED